MLFTSPDPAADPHFAQILLDLQKAAYAVEAELLGDDRIPPLNETLTGLAAFRGYWVVYGMESNSSVQSPGTITATNSRSTGSWSPPQLIAAESAVPWWGA